MCKCVSVDGHVNTIAQKRPEEGIRLPGAVVANSFEPPSVSPGNQTQVIWKVS